MIQKDELYNNNKKAIAAFIMVGALAVGFTACSKDDLVKETEPTTLNKLCWATT